MAGSVRPVNDERDGLLEYLAQQRYVLRLTAYGLTDQQARSTPSVSELSVGGLIKHLCRVESHWVDIVLQRQAPFDPNADWGENFRLGPDQTLDRVLEDYQRVATNTDQVIAGIDDLGQTVPIPRDTPWFPRDVESWSVRWVLLHLIEETARHAGHADIVRESIDGATAFSLMAAAEDWPASPWIQPWSVESAAS
jgi:uncharacterized damage-inducible protein DinB